MENHKLTTPPQSTYLAAEEMTAQELDEVSGGIIVVGGKYKKVSIGTLLNKFSQPGLPEAQARTGL